MSALLREILLGQPQLQILLQAGRNLQKTDPGVALPVGPCDLAARLDRVAGAGKPERDLDLLPHVEIAPQMHADATLAQIQEIGL